MTTQSLWSQDEIIPVVATGSDDSAMAMIGETLHLVWQADQMLYHARHLAGAWSQPMSVAYGAQPALAADPAGRLHCLFTHRFLRNDEIYEVSWDGERWSLPVNVSLTYGSSTQPALAIAADGVLHATWSDTTPGYSTIYYGTRSSTFWANRPVPGARGVMPAIAVASDGTVFIAWSDRRGDTGAYDVFCTVYRDGVWSPPEAVSDSPASHALGPRLVVDSRDQCHVVWQEEEDGICRIRHADRRPNGWSRPTTISRPDADCRLAQVTANRAGYIHAVWWDGESLVHRPKPVAFDAAWCESESVVGCRDATALLVGISSARQLHIVWNTAAADGAYRLRHTSRLPYPRFTVFMPIIAR